MTYDNDPNRRLDPDRPTPSRFALDRDGSFGWVPAILAVAAVALLIMLLLPARNDTAPRVTENTPGIERSTPPASKPNPTPPAPTPPQ